MEFILPGPGNYCQMAKAVIQIKVDGGKNKGKHHMNPILDTSGYIVEFPDGTKK